MEKNMHKHQFLTIFWLFFVKKFLLFEKVRLKQLEWKKKLCWFDENWHRNSKFKFSWPYQKNDQNFDFSMKNEVIGNKINAGTWWIPILEGLKNLFKHSLAVYSICWTKLT